MSKTRPSTARKTAIIGRNKMEFRVEGGETEREKNQQKPRKLASQTIERN
jgi:hypothetical protein